MTEEKKKEFWVANISDRNVTLTDLATSIPARKNRNLLATKSPYTLEQLEASAKSGSIHAKSDKIKVRKFSPIEMPAAVILVEKEPRPGKLRSLVEIKEKRYAELIYSDEQFVAELSEIDNPTEPDK